MHTHPVHAGYQLRENGLWLSDNTIGDVNTSRHGLTPKLPGDPAKYLDGAGNFSVPGAVGGIGGPIDYTRHVWSFIAHPSIATFININPANNMSSAGGTWTSSSDASGPWITQTTGAAIGNFSAHITGGVAWTYRSWEPVFFARTKTTTTLTGLRFWVGMANVGLSADDPGGHIMGFRFSPNSAGDTDFMACTRDGTTLTAVSTGVTPAIDTEYLFGIVCVAGVPTFVINNVVVHTTSTTLPGATTLLGAAWYLVADVAVAQSWKLSAIRGSHLQ